MLPKGSAWQGHTAATSVDRVPAYAHKTACSNVVAASEVAVALGLGAAFGPLVENGLTSAGPPPHCQQGHLGGSYLAVSQNKKTKTAGWGRAQRDGTAWQSPGDGG